MKGTGTVTTKTTLKLKNKVREVSVLDFKTYCAATALESL